MAEAVCFARDLVNEPGGSLTPSRFADLAVEMAEREGLEITVLDLGAIREAELGGLLGVSRGVGAAASVCGDRLCPGA